MSPEETKKMDALKSQLVTTKITSELRARGIAAGPAEQLARSYASRVTMDDDGEIGTLDGRGATLSTIGTEAVADAKRMTDGGARGWFDEVKTSKPVRDGRPLHELSAAELLQLDATSKT